MKLKINLSALLIVILFSACNQSFYGPALHQSDIAYLPKPMSSDSAKSSTYISGALVLNEGVNLSDELTSGQLNISRANTFKNFNLAYGAFGVFGNYHNNTLESTEPDYFSDKFFGAAGGRLSGDFSINSGGRADFRIIGFEAAYSYEFGDYADFRKTVTNEMSYNGQRVIYSDTRTSNFTAGLTSEIIFHTHKPANQFGFRLFVGKSASNNDIYINKATNGRYVDYDQKPIYYTFAYFTQIQQCFFIIETGLSSVQFRIGVKL